MLRAVIKQVLIFALGLSLCIWGYAKDAVRQVPFNGVELYSTNIKPFYQWNGVWARMDSGTQTHQPWQENKARLVSLPLGEMARQVNNIVNTYAYIDDQVNWGASDYWETVAEFFAKGGDCEDFAIAKYAWLRSLGVAEDELRLAIVYDRIRNMTHAVVILHIEGKAMILDSQIKDIRDSGTSSRYRMIYSINRLGWWLPELPKKIKLSAVQDMPDVEPSSGGDILDFSQACLAGAILPECLNTIQPH